MSGAARAGVTEPLAEVAALAREWATVCCQVDGVKTGCRAYHGFWPFMRLMGLGKTLSGMPERYLNGMTEHLLSYAKVPAPTPVRVLISGCADASALAHVLEAGRLSGMPVAVTALDRCETPLRLCAWYAQEQSCSITTCCEDIVAHNPLTPYDLIVTSSFLGYFHPSERPALFQRYAQLLAPGGLLLFGNRLRPGDETQAVGFSAAQAEAFGEQAAGRSTQLPAGTSLSADQARAMALEYASSFRSYPLSSAESLQRLATQAGLLSRIEAVPAAPARAGSASGPTLADGSGYVFVRLSKPLATPIVS